MRRGGGGKVFGDGLLLLYHRPTLRRDAATVWEHIDAFGRYSRFAVWGVNTEGGFPEGLRDLDVAGIVLHYSLFGPDYCLNDAFYDYLARSRSSYKVAFFQDEHRYCRKRFDFLNRFGIDCVFTLVRPAEWDATYAKYTSVPRLVHTLPGYVSEELTEAAGRFGKPDEARRIDVGYRGRRLDYYMGRGGQEKGLIGEWFRDRARDRGWRLDIEAEERKRLYGDAWYGFLAECRSCLGVEAGVSIFDVEDVVREECERLARANPGITFEEVSRRVLHRWEDNIFYRTISPRHFEAAAFRICQILFDGEYSRILQPMRHYVPLRKDFGNFEEAARLFSDPAVRRELTDNAHRDLIASGRYSYRRFVEEFDAELESAGLGPGRNVDRRRVEALLASDAVRRRVRATVLGVRFLSDRVPAPLVGVLRPIARRVLWRATGFH